MLAMIDAGGTTFKCALANLDGAIIDRHRVVTQGPDATIRACLEFLRTAEGFAGASIKAMGIACFGPLDVDERSNEYGCLLSTPKPGWANFPVRQAFAEALGVSVAIDTDVNAALLAEATDGAAAGARRAAYATVGTGIGVSFMQDGSLLAKPSHSEFGHICMEKRADDVFEGHCTFHRTCLEGLASAAAFEARWGDPRRVALDHLAWQIEADYLAQLCLSISLMLRPEKIILGGGLMLAPHLIGLVRSAYLARINGYLSETAEDVTDLIVLPHFGDDAGLIGALKLAQRASE